MVMTSSLAAAAAAALAGWSPTPTVISSGTITGFAPVSQSGLTAGRPGAGPIYAATPIDVIPPALMVGETLE